jgi:hypothetical protein
MIIGLHGHQRSGKDTAYEIIRAAYPHATRLAFADKIKESLAALFGVSIREIDVLKEEGGVFKVEGKSFEHSYTWRSFAQRYGTEAHRDIFGEDFWVDKILPYPDEAGIESHKHELLIITDVRFPNEALRIKNLGGWIVKIKRPEIEYHDSHSSEEDLIDSLIYHEVINDGSLDLYKERVMKVVDSLIY